MRKVYKIRKMADASFVLESLASSLPEGEKKHTAPSLDLFFTLLDTDRCQRQDPQLDGHLLLMYWFYFFLYFLIICWFYRLPRTFIVSVLSGSVCITFYAFIQLFFNTLFFPNLIIIEYAFLQLSCLYKTSMYSSVMFYF